MSQMDIKDLDFQELLPNQGLEIVGGSQQLLEDIVTQEAVSRSTNIFIARETSESDSCGSCMRHPPLDPLPEFEPRTGPTGEESPLRDMVTTSTDFIR